MNDKEKDLLKAFNLKDKEQISEKVNNSYLSKRGYVLKKEDFSIEELINLKLDLTATPLKSEKYSTYNEKDATFPIYIETKNKLYIPKMYGIEKFGKPGKTLKNYIGEKMTLEPKFKGELYENQTFAAKILLDELLNKSGGGILSLMTGEGKCHALNTPILMYDGSIKMVQDIKVGDLLMGDDSSPRTVLSLARGEDEMYDIIPVKGEKYTVNQEHILCLKNTRKAPYITEKIQNKIKKFDVKWWENNREKRRTYKSIEESKEFVKKIEKNHQDIVEISVKDYLKQKKTFKHHFKGYRVPVDFIEKNVPIDPYMIGYWLGDGTSNGSEITCQDSYGISGTLKNLKLKNNKHIPSIYKINSRENRLKLLAGLIDSGGSLYNNGFDFLQKSEELIDDVIYLARSLGFSCYKSIEKKGCLYKNKYIENEYYRIFISGNTHEIPTLIPRKKAVVRKQIKDVLVTGITVKYVGKDNYYGFTLDGNRRYVMGDFTVTHNTITTLYVLSQLKTKTIVVVNKIPLMKQWESEIKQFLPDLKVGFIQGQKNVDTEDCDIVIAMLQSLAKIDYPDTLFEDFGTTVIDECFPYNTHIITSSGKINIGQLYYMNEKKENLPTVKTFNEITKKFEYKKILNVFRKENDLLIEIKCSKMKIKSTENHKYLTYNGWKEAKDLSTNDYIISNYDKNTINSVCPALNEDQYQIVLGSFLGDGHIQLLKNGRYRLRMTHCKEQYEYCKWKAFMFNINNIRYIEKNGYSQKPACQFSTKTFYLFNSLPITKTNIPQWILDDLDERGLAIWYMDDGSINKKSFYTTLSTDSFDEDSQKRIVLKLKSMNIDCKYVNYKKYYYHIVINENGTKELIRLISKYIHNDMLYKLLPRQYINYIEDMSIKILDENTIFCSRENIKKEFLIENHTCKNILHDLPINFGKYNWNNEFLEYGYSKITKITKNIKNFNNSKFKKNYVFDMEIEDNHNYIVKNVTREKIENGFVVHNCHNTSSRVFSKVLSKLCCKYTIGLSATPQRSDGCEHVFKYHIGNIVYQSQNKKRKGKDPILQMVKIDTKEYKEITTVNKFTGKSQIQFTTMLNDLISLPKRNKLIIELIKDCISEDRKILVLSDRRNHLINLKKQLDEDSTITFTYGLFLGSMKITELNKSKASQVILATFSAFGEGVSEKDLDTLILTTPKKFIGHLKNTNKNDSGRLEQIIGRIFRKEHVERNPLIIDLNDNFSVYKNQSSQRKVFYKQHFKNAIVKYQNINLDEYTIDNLNIESIDTFKKKQIINHDECDKYGENENLQNLLQNCIIDE